jgi:putative ABC transport system permease protein
LLTGVIAEGAIIAVAGVAAGAAFGLALTQLAGSYFPDIRLPGPVPVAGSAVLLLVAAVVASALPAARAARVDVMQALRSD